ncbi:unnamed protein product [Durusdinium trenchii]|uniref:Uncharacterized protein n=1 Tax=Durusdinium trenchii TaxID=1381693 RepID=A0ABP0K2E9_9DINO
MVAMGSRGGLPRWLPSQPWYVVVGALLACHCAVTFCQSLTPTKPQSSVARNAVHNFKRLRTLKKIRPGPVPAERAWLPWTPGEEAREPTPEELAREEYLERMLQCEEVSCSRELLEEMQAKDLPPALENYHAALLVCANVTAWQEAKDFLQEMTHERVPPDHTAYHLAMDAAGKGSGAPIEFTEQLFNEMQSRAMVPTPETYTKVIHAYISRGNEKFARRFVREAFQRGLLQIWTNGGVFLQLYDFPTDVALFLLRLAIIDRARELVGRKAGKRTIHVLTREPDMPRNTPGMGLSESAVKQVLEEFGIKESTTVLLPLANQPSRSVRACSTSSNWLKLVQGILD